MIENYHQDYDKWGVNHQITKTSSWFHACPFYHLTDLKKWNFYKSGGFINRQHAKTFKERQYWTDKLMQDWNCDTKILKNKGFFIYVLALAFLTSLQTHNKFNYAGVILYWWLYWCTFYTKYMIGDKENFF